ncbi:unnamed protein product [marine sediment metagenome]|uniref:Uncharacterized protein n=1 Tax=marine sediment metagenome TaxID=412755 RepID=X1UL53_9ZZZZ
MKTHLFLLASDMGFEKEEYDRISRKSEEKMKEIEETRVRIEAEEQQLLESMEENKVILKNKLELF